MFFDLKNHDKVKIVFPRIYSLPVFSFNHSNNLVREVREPSFHQVSEETEAHRDYMICQMSV